MIEFNMKNNNKKEIDYKNDWNTFNIEKIFDSQKYMRFFSALMILNKKCFIKYFYGVKIYKIF